MNRGIAPSDGLRGDSLVVVKRTGGLAYGFSACLVVVVVVVGSGVVPSVVLVMPDSGLGSRFMGVTF